MFRNLIYHKLFIVNQSLDVHTFYTFTGFVSKSKLEDSGILNSLEKLTKHDNETVCQRATSVIETIKNLRK